MVARPVSVASPHVRIARVGRGATERAVKPAESRDSGLSPDVGVGVSLLRSEACGYWPQLGELLHHDVRVLLQRDPRLIDHEKER